METTYIINKYGLPHQQMTGFGTKRITVISDTAFKEGETIEILSAGDQNVIALPGVVYTITKVHSSKQIADKQYPYIEHGKAILNEFEFN